MRTIVITAIVTFVILAGLILMAGQVAAHKAPSGMVYDGWCCSGQDCAPADVEVLPNGHVKARTIHGEAVFGPETFRPSTDGQWHACIVQWAEKKGRCLYVPAGT